MRTRRLKEKRRKPEHEIYAEIRSYGAGRQDAEAFEELFDVGMGDAGNPGSLRVKGIAKKKPRSGRKKRQESELT